MNEAADIAGNIPAIVLVSLWWAFLVAWDLLYPRAGPSRPDPVTGCCEAGAGEAQPHGPAWPALRDADPTFDEQKFLEDASSAYEVILRAYAGGDVETLRPLLAVDVLEAFEIAGAGRRSRGETLCLTFIGMRQASIAGVEAIEDGMEISVRFVAEIVNVIRTSNNEVSTGDPQRIVEAHDLWTFARQVSTQDRTWLLVATDEG